MPRIVFVGATDYRGGAARAMTRLYKAIKKYEHQRVHVGMRVVIKTLSDDDVIGGKPVKSKWAQRKYLFVKKLRRAVPRKPFTSPNMTFRSECRNDTGLGIELNESSWDLAVLHWLGDKTLSIREIGQLRLPYAWHLHDMWQFSGADHTSFDQRYAAGYSVATRPPGESGPDINRHVFLKKKKHWSTPKLLICPSPWLAQETQHSTLTRGWPTAVVPNTIDTDFWKPIDEQTSRKELGLPADGLVFLFGSSSGANAHHKGADSFFASLDTVAEQLKKRGLFENSRVVIFGKYGSVPNNLPITVNHLGPVDDDTLRMAYAAASVAIVPSRIESFGQVATEAHACGKPVVATKIGGLTSVVSDFETGRLVTVDDIAELAEAIVWTVDDRDRLLRLGAVARERALELWSEPVVAKLYVDVLLDLYQSG